MLALKLDQSTFYHNKNHKDTATGTHTNIIESINNGYKTCIIQKIVDSIGVLYLAGTKQKLTIHGIFKCVKKK